MCETLAYSAIQSQGRTESWSALATYGDSRGGYAMPPLTSQATHLVSNPVAWKITDIAMTNHRITNLLVLVKVFKVKAIPSQLQPRH